MAAVEIVSFGFLHGEGPRAHVVLDLQAFGDPQLDPRMRELTGRDRLVVRTVVRAPGVRQLLRATVREVAAYAAGRSVDPIVIAAGSAGGRHRSVVVAEKLARRLRRRGHTVTVTHRDIARLVGHR